MNRLRAAPLAAMLAALVLAAACSRTPAPPEPSRGGDGAATAPARDDAGASGTATAAPAAGAAPVEIAVSTGGDFTSGFEGPARDFMRARALPAGADLKDEVAGLARRNPGLGGCSPSASQNQAHLVDLDGDGEQEGVSIYTLESCGGPQYATRVLAVLRQDASRKWVPVVDTALSVRAGDRRPIVAIGDGKVTLAGEDDGFGGKTAPEVIEIPALPGTPGADADDPHDLGKPVPPSAPLPPGRSP